MKAKTMHKPILACVLIAASSLLNVAHAADSAISIHAPYVRLVPPGISTTGGFMVIRNGSADDRRLLKAESPAAAIVELHNHINENGVMKMREVANITVKANGQTELKPGSYHIMLIDLKDELKEGGNVPITLKFDDGSSQTVLAPVRKPQAAMPESMPMHHGAAKH